MWTGWCCTSYPLDMLWFRQTGTCHKPGISLRQQNPRAFQLTVGGKAIPASSSQGAESGSHLLLSGGNILKIRVAHGDGVPDDFKHFLEMHPGNELRGSPAPFPWWAESQTTPQPSETALIKNPPRENRFFRWIIISAYFLMYDVSLRYHHAFTEYLFRFCALYIANNGKGKFECRSVLWCYIRRFSYDYRLFRVYSSVLF